MKKIYIILVIFILAAFSLWGPLMSRVEQAKYSVVYDYGPIQIRDYDSMIIAEAETSGAQADAVREGFKVIADYIFGNNLSSSKVAMTAPVTQQPIKIEMTAPVTQQSDESGQWKVRFFMPSVYTLESLPKPVNKAVKIIKIPEKRYVVIQFSGIADQEKLNHEQNKLEAFIQQNNLKQTGSPVYAFFNPPWTLPFFRRNEVMIEIKK